MMTVNLLEIARMLSPDQQWVAYEKARATPGSEQLAGALEIANPQVRLRYICEHPEPGKLVAHKSWEMGREVVGYYGRAWRNQFEVPGVLCTIARPR
jgi:hypothetical protein